MAEKVEKVKKRSDRARSKMSGKVGRVTPCAPRGGQRIARPWSLGIFSAFQKSIPQGLYHSAQGREERATLGHGPPIGSSTLKELNRKRI
jgi:hypothetical protein